MEGGGAEKRTSIVERRKGHTEGGEKVRDTGGVHRAARNKESVCANGLADESKETK